MGRSPAKYKVSCYVIFEETGRTVPFEDLNEEEKKKAFDVWEERLGKAISEYCQANPGTFSKLPGERID